MANDSSLPTGGIVGAYKNQFVNDHSDPEVDAIWILVSSFIIFTMHSGFGLLESGMVQKKNETNVMMKNLLTVMLGGISFWFVGFGFSFGEGPSSNAMSGNGFFLMNADLNMTAHFFAKYLFQLSFATTSTTIVSGAVAERVNIKAFMIFALINPGLIYVFPAHWMWAPNGWLAELGAFDFAGSAVVHMCGGAAAFVGAFMLGPRNGRYDKDKNGLPMGRPANVILGTFMLWWGWIGFNCGSTFGVSTSLWKLASRTSVVTMNGAMAGGLAGLLLGIFSSIKKGFFFIDVSVLVSGILGGLVGITAIASICKPWEALIIGFIGGLVANGVIALLDKLEIDDPVGAVGVHFGAGVWAMIAVGLFAEVDTVAGLTSHWGLFRGGDGKLLGYNLIACLAITLWSGGLTTILFLILKYTIGIRASLEDEILGFDDVEHGIVNDDIKLEDVKPDIKNVIYTRSLMKSIEEKNRGDVYENHNTTDTAA